MKVKLGDVCIIQSGGTPSRSNLDYWKNGTISWVKISDIKDKYLNFTEEYITYEGLKNSSAKIFSKGTILYTIFATLGEVSILNIEAATNQAIAGIKLVDENVYNDFLYYYLVSKKEEVNNRGRGVAQNNINLSMLKNIEIEMPNIEKQRKIANVLDKVNKIINKRQQQLKKLDELVKSRFIEMFGDPLKNTLKWKIKKLKLIAPANEFTGDIESNNEKYWLLQLDMIESNTGKILSKYFVSLDKIGVSTIKFSKDNVLYSKLRPYLNKVVLPDEAGFATSEMIPLFPTEELNKIFLAFVLRDDGIVRFLNAHVSGSKMPRVQADVFWNLGIILPPSTLQNQFADFVEQTDKSKLEIQKSLDKLEILKKSLMQQYFG